MTQEHIHPLEDKIQLIRKRNNEQEDFSCAYSSYMKEHRKALCQNNKYYDIRKHIAYPYLRAVEVRLA